MITDTYLTQVAKALNSESYTMPNYLTVGTTVITSVTSTDTAISGEIGTRFSATNSRAGTQVLYTGIRSSTSVVNTTNGDAIASVGLLNGTSAGTLMVGEIVSGLTQTTAFDVQFDFYVQPARR